MKKNISISIFLLIVVFSCRESNVKGKSTFYEDGSLKDRYYVDKHNNFHGKHVQYYQSGVKKFIRQYKNGKELTSISYYESGKLDGLTSRNLVDNSYNSRVSFYENGGICEPASDFIDIQFDKRNKNKLIIKHIKRLYCDSIIIHFKKTGGIKDAEDTRTVFFFQSNKPEIILDIKPSDYYNNVLNLMVERYTTSVIEKINKPLTTLSNRYYIQLDKGEKPAKYNIDPIW